MPEITLAYDAGPLQPETRHWGPGIFLQNMLRRLSHHYRLRGVAHRFPPTSGLDIVSWPRIAKTGIAFFELSPLIAGPFDIYWGTNHLLPSALRKPSVVTVHDLLLLNRLDGNGPRQDLFAWRFRASLRRASRIIADSKTTADDLLQMFPEFVTKVEVIHCGFEVPDKLETVSGGGFHGPSVPYMVMLGAHRIRKNLPLAASALRYAKAGGCNIRLLVTGDIHHSFVRLCDESNGLILRSGVLSRREIFELLQDAVALIFPSRYEGFGFPMLEAMAARCPVLAMDIRINREIAGDAAWLLPEDPAQWAKAIRCLSENAAAREELILKGLENLRRFSWERTTQAYVEVFAEALT